MLGRNVRSSVKTNVPLPRCRLTRPDFGIPGFYKTLQESVQDADQSVAFPLLVGFPASWHGAWKGEMVRE